MPRRAAALAAALWLAASVAGAQTVDRILAVVGAAPITLSDVNAAMALGLVPVEQPPPDPERAVLDALIDRQLQLSEVDRYLPPEPAAADIDARVAQVRARFSTAEAFDTALKQTGLTAATLRAHVRDSLRIESYLQQRFGAGYQPSEDEVLTYYRSHQTDFTRDGVVRPYAEVRDEARRKLMAERNAALVRDWITGLRRRVDVTILPK
jgi:parvulin-like peptidyl-prolyl isomerase